MNLSQRTKSVSAKIYLKAPPKVFQLSQKLNFSI